MSSAVQAVDYLLIGHLAADVVPASAAHPARFAPGGTVAYAARTSAAFGLRVGVLTSAQADEPLLAALREVAQVMVIPASATTTYENIYTGHGRRQRIHAVAERLYDWQVPAAWRDAPMVHLAPIADEVDGALAQGFPDARILLTPQGWMRRWDAEGWVSFQPWHDEDTLRRADLVVISEEDIAGAPSLEAVYQDLTKTLVVTEGERGGRMVRAGRPGRYAAEDAVVNDPTGAGDVFAASLMAAWWLCDDFDRALTVAAHLAAVCVTRAGLAGTPTAAEARTALTALA